MVMSHLTPFREDKAIASFDTRLIYGFHGYILHGNIYAMWAKLARKTRKQMFLRNIEVRAKQNPSIHFFGENCWAYPSWIV
jgi:hypothetical protein